MDISSKIIDKGQFRNERKLPAAIAPHIPQRRTNHVLT